MSFFIMLGLLFAEPVILQPRAEVVIVEEVCENTSNHPSYRGSGRSPAA